MLNMELFWAPIGLLVVVTLALVIRLLLRRWYPPAVVCWFCGEKCKVPYDQINSWDCPYCDQYNGFNKDGDYNKPILAQYCEELNVTPKSKSLTPASAGNGQAKQPTNLLCENCSQNQFLKIKQLANFVPSAEETFDMEVDAYKHHLEQIYRLCRVCETRVKQELARQDAQLRAKAIDASSTSTLHNDISNCFEEEEVYRWLTPVSHILHFWNVICALALLTSGLQAAFPLYVHFSRTYALPLFAEYCLKHLPDFTLPFLIAGTFTQIVAVYFSGLNRLRAIDAFSCFCWLFMMLLFLLLKDSHIFSRGLVSVRLCLSSVNLLLSLASSVRRRKSYRRIATQEHESSPGIQEKSDNFPHSYDCVPTDQSCDITASDTRADEETVEDGDVPYGKMRMLQLGAPASKEKRKDPFKVFGNAKLANIPLEKLAFHPAENGSIKRYPLLSPPRFCPSKNSSDLLLPASAQGPVFGGPFRQNGTVMGNGIQHRSKASPDFKRNNSDARLRERGAHHGQIVSNDYSQTIHFTSAPTKQGSRSLLRNIIFGISLLVNLIVIVALVVAFHDDFSLDRVKSYLKSKLLS